MNNAVNERLGRHRHRMKAERMRMLTKLNELAKETGLKGDIARSILLIETGEENATRSDQGSV
jgi:hypothetical protein